ncbi:hypothetical protein H0X06_06210 [Candidatus Dependentiae bacterium]|nr:hypothetical protein [Candidatus Dependentiae bacterium]
MKILNILVPLLLSSGMSLLSMEKSIQSSYNDLLGPILPKELQLIISLKNCSEILDFLEKTIPFHCALSSCRFSVESPLKDQIATAHKGGIVKMWCLRSRILLWEESYSSEVHSIQIDLTPCIGDNSNKTTINYCNNTNKCGPYMDGSFIEGTDLTLSPLTIGIVTGGLTVIDIAATHILDQNVPGSSSSINLTQAVNRDHIQSIAYPIELGYRFVYSTCIPTFSSDSDTVKENHMIALRWIKENIHCLLASFLIHADDKRQKPEPYTIVVNSIEHKLLSTLPLLVRQYLISQFPISTDDIDFFDYLDKDTHELGCSLQ